MYLRATRNLELDVTLFGPAPDRTLKGMPPRGRTFPPVHGRSNRAVSYRGANYTSLALVLTVALAAFARAADPAEELTRRALGTVYPVTQRYLAYYAGIHRQSL